MMQPHSESHMTSARFIALIGFMCLSLSGCCLFSPKKAENDHHAAVVNTPERTVNTPTQGPA